MKDGRWRPPAYPLRGKGAVGKMTRVPYWQLSQAVVQRIEQAGLENTAEMLNHSFNSTYSKKISNLRRIGSKIKKYGGKGLC